MEDVDFVTTHRRVWGEKPNLQHAYGRYHDLILSSCPNEVRVLELGCGLGHLTEQARARGHGRWVATDLTRVTNAHVICNALALPFPDAAFDRIVFIDVLHHLASPLAFFREAARVLTPGGKIVAVEPWVTAFSYFLYRFFHHEGCDLSRDPEKPFSRAGKHAYEGDCGVTSLVCRRIASERWRGLGFSPPVARPFNDFAYLTTRGFQETRDAPKVVYQGARRLLDQWLGFSAPLLGVRALIHWERVP